MNKRFFTLMAAVMLAGSPFAANYAFAAEDDTPEVVVDDQVPAADFSKYNANEGPVLANGVKFILKSGENYVITESVKVKNGTFNQIATDDQGVQVFTDDAEEATVFEVRNYVSNALGVTFSLYADGKQFGFGGTSSVNASVTFTATKGADYKLGNLTAINVAQVGGSTPVFDLSSVQIGTLAMEYDEEAFTEYNKNNVSLSFDASGLEGNVFSGMVAVTFEGQASDAVFVDGTYLVKGKAADIKAFKEGQSKETAAKLTFVYLKNEQYKLDALVDGEGYKFTTINGAQFYAEKNPAVSNNAAFTGFYEADQLNNEGALYVTISPVDLGADANEDYEDLIVAAVKASASDTKSYVTTLNKDDESGSKLTPILPTLGANAYFAASEFVKQGAVSAYNIYFLSNNKSEVASATEYHKYLVSECHENSNRQYALAANDIDLTTPYAQWVVTGFDGRYTITLENRMTGDELELRLGATDNAGVYTIDKANDEKLYVTSPEAAAEIGLAGTTIKLIPTTVGKYDGFKQLAKADREEGLILSFTGKSAQLGERTYYAEMQDLGSNSTPRFYLRPNTDETKATALQFNAYEPTAAEVADGTFVNEIDYLCLNAAGQLTTAIDSLVYPVYTISKTYKVGDENVTKYLDQYMYYSLDEEHANKFIVVKDLKGDYVLATKWTNIYEEDGVEVSEDLFGAVTVWNKSFNRMWNEICNISGEYFANVSFTVNDNSDKTTLPAISRHATFENPMGAISLQENKNGILEGILSAAPMTFWLDTADSEKTTPSFYISKGIAAAEEETPETKADEAAAMRNFLVYAPDSLNIFDEGSALQTQNPAYILEGTDADLKAIFRPAALVAEDTLKTVVDGKEVLAVTKDAKAGQIDALNNFQFGICLADETVADEYVVYSKANKNMYLYSLNGKLGFGSRKQALVVTLGEGDPTANEAIEAESGIEVIGGQGVVTVQGAAGKVITVANILGQTIANQVAASDNVTIAAPAGIVVVSVDGEATKVIVK